MCTCDEHTVPTKRAKAWAITLIVFGVLLVLGSIQNILNPATNTRLAGVFSLLAGGAGVVCGSITACGIPNVPQSEQQAVATKKALTISSYVGVAANGLYLLAFVFGILSTLDLLACANNPCPDFDSSGVWLPRAMSTDCVTTACEEKDYPKMGWQLDKDCAATWGAAKNQKGRCMAGYTHYLSEHITSGDGRPGFQTCVPRTCCSTSSTPPSGFVAASAFSCPAPATDPNYWCGLKAFCKGAVPFAYGSVGAAVLWLIIYITSVVFISIASSGAKATAMGPAI